MVIQVLDIQVKFSARLCLKKSFICQIFVAYGMYMYYMKLSLH